MWRSLIHYKPGPQGSRKLLRVDGVLSAHVPLCVTAGGPQKAACPGLYPLGTMWFRWQSIEGCPALVGRGTKPALAWTVPLQLNTLHSLGGTGTGPGRPAPCLRICHSQHILWLFLWTTGKKRGRTGSVRGHPENCPALPTILGWVSTVPSCCSWSLLCSTGTFLSRTVVSAQDVLN